MIDASLDATDCLDTEAGLILPGGRGDCIGAGFQANSFVDLFQVSLPSGVSLDLTMTSSEFNPTLQVFNAALDVELACDWSNRSGAASLSLPLVPGDYVVAARSLFEGNGNAYNLVLAPEPGAAALGLAALLTLAGLRGRPR
jgi:hypothetical protein